MQSSALTGKMVKNVGRYGKVFYMEMVGDGAVRHPVMHLGMTGNVLVSLTVSLHFPLES